MRVHRLKVNKNRYPSTANFPLNLPFHFFFALPSSSTSFIIPPFAMALSLPLLIPCISFIHCFALVFPRLRKQARVCIRPWPPALPPPTLPCPSPGVSTYPPPPACRAFEPSFPFVIFSHTPFVASKVRLIRCRTPIFVTPWKPDGRPEPPGLAGAAQHRNCCRSSPGERLFCFP